MDSLSIFPESIAAAAPLLAAAIVVIGALIWFTRSRSRNRRPRS
jgi:hypothetical protein